MLSDSLYLKLDKFLGELAKRALIVAEILVQYSCKGSFRYLFSKSIYFWMQIELSVETGAGWS